MLLAQSSLGTLLPLQHKVSLSSHVSVGTMRYSGIGAFTLTMSHLKLGTSFPVKFSVIRMVRQLRDLDICSYLTFYDES